MATPFRAGVCGAFLLGAVGCTTEPVTVKTLDRTQLDRSTDAIVGPVFFMPAVQLQLTIQLALEEFGPTEKPLLKARPSTDPGKPMRLEALRKAESAFPLVLTDRAGTLIDVTQFEITLNEHSVLTDFNRAAEDKTGEIALSIVKLGFAVASIVPAARMGPSTVPPLKGRKRDTPAQLFFTFEVSQLTVGESRNLECLIESATGRSFRDLFWIQNPALKHDEFADVVLEPVTVVRTMRGAFDPQPTTAARAWSAEDVHRALSKGVKGIPYRIPADNTFEFSFNDGDVPHVTHIDLKSPEGQPLLYAPIKERRFGKATSSVTLDPNGSLKVYKRTQTSAAKGAVDSALGVAAQLKTEMAARAETRKQEQTERYELAVKLATRLKEKADVEATIASLTRDLDADPGREADLAPQLRQKRAELDIINIKIQALLAGIDLP